MHILFLSHYFPPEVNAPASRTWEHARRWTESPDIGVTVITNHPHHPYGKIYPGYENRRLTRERMGNVRIRRVKTLPAANRGYLGRTLNYMFFMGASVIASLFVSKPDVVVATSPQFFCAIAGFAVSRIRRKPFVFELRDIWPESIVSVSAMKPGPAIRFLERIELFLYKKSSRVVALTNAFRSNLIGRGINGGKIDIVRNGADLRFFKPEPAPASLADALGVAGKFVVSYIGTVGMAHAVDKILETAELLTGHPDIVFLIVGEGAEKRRIEKLAESRGLANVRALPGVPKADIPNYYALSDLVLVTLRKTPLFRTVIPSKIFEIMASAKPVLCSVDGECREIVESAGAGVFVEPENPKQMADAILELQNDREKRTAMGKNGRAYVEKHFDRDSLARRYLDILKNVHRNGGHPKGKC